MAKPTKTKKKLKTSLLQANIYVQASFNNTLITVSDQVGNVVGWCSSGRLGFSGTRKATPHAATQVMQNILEKIKDLGIQEVNVNTCGVGAGREASLRALAASSVNIKSIIDSTPVAHNGPRLKKRRRV